MKNVEKFDIYSKISFRDVGNFFRYLCELVLRHQMQVSNYFVNSFYSVGTPSPKVDAKWKSMTHLQNIIFVSLAVSYTVGLKASRKCYYVQTNLQN